MKNKFLSILSAAMLAAPAVAQECSINFNYGVIIDPGHIRALDENGHTLIQINDDKQLFIRGREVDISPSQQAILEEYSLGVRSQIPEIVSIAIESVDIGLKAVNQVISGLTGANSESHKKTQEKFDELHWRLRKRFNHSDDSYYIAPQDLDDFDEIFAGEFEKEVEEIMVSSIGSLLVAVGEAITNSDEVNSETRMQTFDERISTISQDIELNIGDKAEKLEARAQRFCRAFIELNQIENRLQQNIPQLSFFDLINTQIKTDAQ